MVFIEFLSTSVVAHVRKELSIANSSSATVGGQLPRQNLRPVLL
jgi:hypothetical protein